MPRNPGQYIILGFLGALSGAILAGTSLFFIPKQYEGSMEIRRVEVVSEVLRTPPGVMYFATEMPDGWFFRSRNSLVIISESLNLPERWSLSEGGVLYRLRESVRVEPMGESIYRVTVSRSDPDEAYEIANALQETVRDRLTKMYSDTAGKYLDHLDRKITEQSNKVVEKKLVIQTIRKTAASPDSQQEALENATDGLRMAEALLAEMKGDFETKKQEAANFPDPLEVMTPTTRPKTFMYPKVGLVLSIGAASGLLVGLVVTFILQRREATLEKDFPSP